MQRKILFLFLLITQLVGAQNQPPYTPADARIKSFEQRKSLEKASLVNGIEFRNIGPTIMSGRVTDMDVSPSDPTHFYVAYASGGLWKTVNNGQSFTSLFDNEMVMTIGDIAVDWARNTIWIGTGEVNSSRSSYAGTGIYKSTNAGKTWQHLGLGESHHIGRIILHPTDPNIAWVAALGHLYSPNKERGIYKTTDGGKTWKQVLFVNENAGGIDLVMEPNNAKVLYAGMWERERRAWNFIEGGKGTGIYKSTDGGETWHLLTDAKSGFPNDEFAGRIGLSINKMGGKTTLYAAIDNYNPRPKEEPDPDVVTRDMLRTMSKDDFLKLPKYQIADYLQSNGFPRDYNADKIIGMVKKDEIKPIALVEYVEDANSLLLSSTVKGLEIYKSTDDGKTWKKTHEKPLDAYSSYGYYFGMVHVSPSNPNKVYTYGVPIMRSDDGGKTWENINGDNVHSDHHALWINPKREGHLINGNDGGLNISYDDGKTWIKCNTPAVGQFYSVMVDDARPYNVYGGLQDNGVWMGPSNYQANTNWHDSGQYPYKSIGGGDGMMVQVDTRDNATVYTGSQFGNYLRLNTKTNERQRITPRQNFGERPLRWNWETPIWLSKHNQDILYMGSNKLHRSFNQGTDFAEISGDLTAGGRKGDVAFGTLTTIHESPLRFGLVYVGSDDGLVHMTPDGGNTWNNITAGLPKDMWISQVWASAHSEGTVYVSLNGYRWDDFTPYLYMSSDYGKTWSKLGTDLPLEPVNVVKEDPSSANILYVGTDHGLYVSFDKGKSFMQWSNGLPAVAVHDLAIQNRDKELVVGTHGRSIYAGNIKELQQLTDELMAKPLVVFEIERQRYNARWGFTGFGRTFTPEVKIPMYVSSAGKATFTVQNESGTTMKTFEADLKKGLNYPIYDLTFDEKLLETYNKTLNEKIKPDEKPIRIKKADDGKCYLYGGNFKIIVEKGGEKKEAKLMIDAGTGGGGRGNFGEPEERD
ncbi:MAG: glycosyl hydrolase [Saprospiraceae bacterium]|nr:glycosyl hydrolase [Saprospiraceae bacterium]